MKYDTKLLLQSSSCGSSENEGQWMCADWEGVVGNVTVSLLQIS